MITEQRPLGLLEKYQISKLITKCYGSVTGTALLRHNSPAPATDKEAIKTFYLNRLYPAVSRLVQKHPQLTMIVLDADKPTARFATLSSFNLAAMVNVNSNVKFWEQAVIDDIISTEVDKEFGTTFQNGPLWSLGIDTHPERPHECAISFTLHHVIGDGKSIMLFWKELLEQLKDGEMVDSSNGYQIDIMELHVIKPPQEHRNPVMPNEIKLPGTKEDELAMWQGDYEAIRDKTAQKHDTAVRTVVVDGEHWPKIVKKCKQHGVTPHAALMVACALAFAELYPDRVVRTMTPVNTRPLCDPPVPEDEMGNFFGNFFRFWRPGFSNGKSFWELAIEYQARVREGKAFAAGFANHFFGHLKNFPEDFINYWYSNWEKYPMGRAGGICVSDLGLITTKRVTSTEWQLQEIFFNQSSHMYTLALTINTISTSTAMQACVAWQRNTLDISKADRYGSLIAKYLIQCIDQ
ncbi:hypothetical protein O0I10_001901 [Lichtheimia ornata]|uniref:Condensation domain-containing protein n=1 Tax=Lichtheimia ornata TaxID=688661 RepID=A0AAD7VA47_9FUNG|nr:uncharacterized protein O0I10_001901 [Lichtheimia ornata]KAJ8662208.1 hypothetical protein O0I10_001901 [Lichtheimia ornata]